jgi:hypothetical protein
MAKHDNGLARVSPHLSPFAVEADELVFFYGCSDCIW